MDIEREYKTVKGEITQPDKIDPMGFFMCTDGAVHNLLKAALNWGEWRAEKPDAFAKERVVDLLQYAIGDCAWSFDLGDADNIILVGHLEQLAVEGTHKRGDPWIELRVPISELVEQTVWYAHQGRQYHNGQCGPLSNEQRDHLTILYDRLGRLSDMVKRGLWDIDAATNHEAPS